MRKKKKIELFDKRTTQRLDKLDENRSTLGTKITEQDVIGLCSRIKRKKHASIEDMARLSTAFLQNKENISVFIKVTGAINVIIKEFTCCENTKQIDAAEFLCNLSLGDETCCEKIAYVAGVYLTIYIMNLQNTQLTTTCLWIMQNLAASGDKPLDILFSQGLVNNTIQVFSESKAPEIRQECLKIIDIIITKKGAALSDEDKQNLQKCIMHHNEMEADPNALLSKVLLSILELNNFTLDDKEATDLLEMVSLHIVFLDIAGKKYKDTEVILLLNFRLLSKLFEKNDRHLARFLEVLEAQDIKISTIINEMTLNPKFFGLVKELLWLASNIFQSNHRSIPRYLAYDDFIENLEIPRMFKLLK
ncbi:unnamed protein product [Diamesa hyperborea]